MSLLSRDTRIKLRLLVHLGSTNRGEYRTMDELGEECEIPATRLKKFVNQLHKLGYIEVNTGRDGGIRLGVAPDEILLNELLVDLDDRPRSRPSVG